MYLQGNRDTGSKMAKPQQMEIMLFYLINNTPYVLDCPTLTEYCSTT